MPKERVKYAVVDGSEAVVGTCIAFHDLDARYTVLTIRRRAPVPSSNPHDSP